VGRVAADVLRCVAGTLLKYNPYFNVFLGSRASASPYANYLHQMYLMARLAYQRPVRVMVADEIGLGKTVEAVRAIRHLMLVDGVRRVLVVVPPTLLDQWVEKDLYNLGIDPVVIDRENVEELLERARRGGIADGVFIGSMDRLKLSGQRDAGASRYPYFELLSSVDWDLVVVDEAHKLSYLGSPSLRYERIGFQLCRNRARHCILLTATPHRGRTDDFMARVALLDRTLIPRPSELAAKVETLGLRTRLLADMADAIFFRRTKEDVNKIEGRQVFRPAHQYPVLIRVPPEIESIYVKALDFATLGLDRYYADPRLQGVRELLRKLLIKRAMSSEQALLNTFMRIGAKRTGADEDELNRLASKLEGYLSGDEDAEEEPDEELSRFIEMVSAFVDPRKADSMRAEVESLVANVRRVASEGRSPKVRAVAEIVGLALGEGLDGLGEPFRDMRGGRILVFTEFRDTAHQLFDQLDKVLGERFAEVSYGSFSEADSLKREYVGRAKGGDLLRYVKVVPVRAGKLVGIALLTSESKKFLREFQRMLEDPRLATVVLVSTDVAAEGLNMQAANMVVMYEIPWSPMRREQRIGRVWRLGQGRDVYVFDLHMGTDFEREILENYTIKIVTIAEEAGYATVSYGGLAFYVPQSGADEEYGYALRVVGMESFTESAVLGGFAQALRKALGSRGLDAEILGREIARLATEIVRLARQLRKELEEISRYRAKPDEVRNEVGLLLGVRSDEEARAILLRLIVAASRLGLANVQDVGDDLFVNGVKASKRSTRDLASALAEVVKVARWDSEACGGTRILLARGMRESDAAFLAMLVAEGDGGSVLYAEPILVVQSKGGSRILRGAELAEELSRLLESSEERFAASAEVIQALKKRYESAAGSCVSYLDEIQAVARGKPARYASSKALAGLRVPGGSAPVIRAPAVRLSESPLAIFIPASQPLAGTEESPGVAAGGGRAVTPEKKEMVKTVAENLVRSFFESMGYRCVKRSEYSPYDFELYDRDGRLVYYVEVKGHETGELVAELSESENEFAKEHEDMYMVCVVTEALTNPRIRCDLFKELKLVKTVFMPTFKYIYRADG